MASSISLFVPLPSSLLSRSEPGPRSLCFCGLRREALGFCPLVLAGSARIRASSSSRHAVRKAISVAASDNGSAAANGKFDYDLVVIGAGVGGHGAALHAVEKGLKTAVIEGDVIRGCVPSKALLPVSGRMRELQSEHHMKALGLQVSSAGYDRTLPWSLLIRDDSTKFCELLLAEVENFEVGQYC